MIAPSRQDFPGETTSPSAARRFAGAALDAFLPAPVSADLRADLELVVSELVTNAVRAGSPTVHVEVEVVNRRVVVRVGDAAVGWPEARDAGIHDTSGRGLPLISAVASSWGVRMTETEKVVWAELDIPAADLAVAD